MVQFDPQATASSDADTRLAAIVDSSYDAIISKNLNSIVTSWNQAAERLFGYTADEMIGQSIVILLPEERRGEEDDIIGRIRNGERVASYETVRRRKDGALIAVSLTISPIRAADGTIVGASKIARDITPAKESERRIRLLLQEVNHRVKNQFAVILSMVRETARRTPDPSQFEEQVRGRIMSLSRSHDLLVNSGWAGATVFELAQEHLKPFGHPEQLSLSGPLLRLDSAAVQNLGMAFHELGTNSSKYGALSSGAGTVTVTWQTITGAEGEKLFELVWDELSVPFQKERRGPARTGFGDVVLKRVAPDAVLGRATLERTPGHVRWAITAPLERVLLASAVG
ncbi:MAG: PAS domain S-box protein [Rhizobiaceae bacterium]